MRSPLAAVVAVLALSLVPDVASAHGVTGRDAAFVQSINGPQVAFEKVFASFTAVAAFMQLPWSWPLVESAHFIGLTLLLGAIAAWDLRLLGLLKHVPAAAFHKLVPFAVIGFTINVTSGSLSS